MIPCDTQLEVEVQEYVWTNVTEISKIGPIKKSIKCLMHEMAILNQIRYKFVVTDNQDRIIYWSNNPTILNWLYKISSQIKLAFAPMFSTTVIMLQEYIDPEVFENQMTMMVLANGAKPDA